MWAEPVCSFGGGWVNKNSIKRPDMPTIWAKTNRVDHADYARLLHRPLKSQVSLEWQAPAQDFRLFYLLRRTGRRVKPCPVMAL